MTDHRTMRLGLFIQPAGHHAGGWRYPGAATGGEDLPLLQAIAATAERGRLDMIFLGDELATSREATASMMSRFEPLTLLSALAMTTTHVGLAATASTTYGEPYHTARMFASLDHLSRGRAAWNIVTSSNPQVARNFSCDEHLEHDRRYERATEFVAIVKGLWDSFEDDAFIRDKETGVLIDECKLHYLNHKGDHFAVAGPLNVSRCPQGRPVLIQAGSSDVGQDLAVREAEVAFTAQQTLDEGRAFYRALKDKAAAIGRDADGLLVMPGVMPIVGGTESEARGIYEQLQNRIAESQALHILSERLGHDVSGFALDAPVPELPESDGVKSRAKLLRDLAKRDKLTLRQLFLLTAGARGHRIVIGTPEQVADDMEAWFREGAADGFNILPPYFMGAFAAFVDHVIPVLRRRGLFRTDYEGTTLRENLGLPKPPNRYTQARA